MFFSMVFLLKNRSHYFFLRDSLYCLDTIKKEMVCYGLNRQAPRLCNRRTSWYWII